MTKDYKHRVFGLDLMRSWAIIAVVLGHSASFLNGIKIPFLRYVIAIDGVEIFFVLSGFLVGGLFIRKFHGQNYHFTITDLKTFWKRRWFRTLPNYYLFLIVNALAWWLNGSDMSHVNLGFVAFLQNINGYTSGFFMESWSLSIEEWFYVIMPLFFIVASQVTKRKSFMLLVLLVLILTPLVLRYLYASSDLNISEFDTHIRKSVLRRLDAINYGVLAFYFFFYYPKFWHRIRYVSFIIGIAMMVSLFNVDYLQSYLFKQTYYFSYLPFSIALMLPLINSWKTCSGLFLKVVTHISLISYSMYLINLSLSIVFSRCSSLPGLLIFILFWCILILSASLVYKYFEKPIMDLRDKK